MIVHASETPNTLHLLPDCLISPYATPSDPPNEQEERLYGGQAIARIVSNSV